MATAIHTNNPSRRLVVGGLAALGAGAPPVAAAPADAQLIALGVELEAAWAHERDVSERIKGDHSDEANARFDAAYEVVSRIVDEIEVLPANTLEGLRVKALAISWCYNGDEVTGSELNEQNTSDVRIAASIVDCLLKMGKSPSERRYL